MNNDIGLVTIRKGEETVTCYPIVTCDVCIFNENCTKTMKILEPDHVEHWPIPVHFCSAGKRKRDI